MDDDLKYWQGRVQNLTNKILNGYDVDYDNADDLYDFYRDIESEISNENNLNDELDYIDRRDRR